MIIAISIVAILLLITIFIKLEDLRQQELHPVYEVMGALADAPGPDFSLVILPIPDEGRYYTMFRRGDILTIVRRPLDA